MAITALGEYGGIFSDAAKIGYVEGRQKVGLTNGGPSMGMLLHMEGANGGTVFTDSSGRHTVTAAGSAITSTTQKKFGTTALYVGGAANYGYLQIADSDDFNFLTGDHELDFWIYLTALPSGSGDQAVATLIGQSNATADGSWFVYVYTDGKIAVGVAGVNEIATASGVIQANAWQHVYISRKHSTGNTHIYVGGVLKAYGNTVVWNNSSNALRIGATSSTKYRAEGYIDELRINPACTYSGTTVGAQDFIPPISAYFIYSTTGETASVTQIDFGSSQTIAYTDIRVPSNTLSSASDVQVSINGGAYVDLVTGGAYDTEKAYPPNVAGNFTGQTITFIVKLNSSGTVYQEAGRPFVKSVTPAAGGSKGFPRRAVG